MAIPKADNGILYISVLVLKEGIVVTVPKRFRSEKKKNMFGSVSLLGLGRKMILLTWHDQP